MKTRLTALIGTSVVAILALSAPALTQVDLNKNAKLRAPKTFVEKAPELYKVNFDTSKGPFVVEVHRAWAPIGADRFYNLVKNGFYDDVRFFRAIKGFMVQFGMHGNPSVTAAWKNESMKDDPRKQSNKRGYVTFANMGSANTRNTQAFISLGDNTQLDALGFAPFGMVVSGMDNVMKINTQYSTMDSRGTETGPDQNLITRQGNAYLTKEFPKLDYIKTATIAK